MKCVAQPRLPGLLGLPNYWKHASIVRRY